ncbi:head GIN domain-containing protein [Algoriphagus jejuensis]|uniref:Head GIN domain-containing protein n=1 Tax=Algoriphagus jejuensis TaxID=419934 RepID=A0ABP3YIA8_9BACT
MKTKTTLLSLLAVLALFSCTANFSSKDSDNRITDERDLDKVTKLKVSGIFNLYLSQGDKPSLKIDGDEEQIKKLKVIQNGETLELKFDEIKNNFFGESRPDVYLTLSELEMMEFDGVGNLKFDRPFKVDDLRLKGNGVGNISLQFEAKKIDADFNMMGNLTLGGSAEEITISNEGIGNIEASGLQAQDMTLNSSGIGRVSVNCTGDLSITVNGIGAVSYTGNPNVIKEEINGIGKVTRN